jgi:hypothetical protein
MKAQKLSLLSDSQSERMNGGGTGTGEAVQGIQQTIKDAFGMPAPRFAKSLGLPANTWGQFVSDDLSKVE